MKRLLLFFFLASFPLALAAQVADRDVLVTPDGTLYTIESVYQNGSHLNLTVQRGTEKNEMVVPGSMTSGRHWRPALAYDNDSATLFVFWIHSPNLSSELLISSYSRGAWSPVVSIDPQQYDVRSNLRIGITRKISTQQPDGTYSDTPTLLIHAIWWQQSGARENGRYALFTVNGGAIASVELHNLDDFAPSPGMFPNDVDPNFNADILRAPAFADNGTQDSIDVIYGDTYWHDFVRVRVKPIFVEGRIHIPIGAHPGGPRVVVAKSFVEPWTGPISVITSPHDNDMLLYNTTANAVNYIMYSNGAWSSVKSVPLSDKLSADAAVAALTRMLTQ